MPTQQRDMSRIMVDPDRLIHQDDALAFIIWDLDNDGQYEATYGTGIHFGIIEDLLPKERARLNKSKLPIMFGRTALLYGHRVVSFWPANQPKYFSPRIPNNNEGLNSPQFNQLIIQHALPLLLQEGTIDQETLWYDGESNYMGPVGGAGQAVQAPPAQRYKVMDREMTYTEILSVLHTGDSRARAVIKNWICRSPEQAFADVRSRLQCGKPPIWTVPKKEDLPRGVGVPVGEAAQGVEFHSQKSLNRAWDEEMRRRVSCVRRRRRLVGRLIAVW